MEKLNCVELLGANLKLQIARQISVRQTRWPAARDGRIIYDFIHMLKPVKPRLLKPMWKVSQINGGSGCPDCKHKWQSSHLLPLLAEIILMFKSLWFFTNYLIADQQ